MYGMFELNVCEDYDDISMNNVINGLLRNGYILTLNPCRYKVENEDPYHTVMVEINGVDESFEE